MDSGSLYDWLTRLHHHRPEEVHLFTHNVVYLWSPARQQQLTRAELARDKKCAGWPFGFNYLCGYKNKSCKTSLLRLTTPDRAALGHVAPPLYQFGVLIAVACWSTDLDRGATDRTQSITLASCRRSSAPTALLHFHPKPNSKKITAQQTSTGGSNNYRHTYQ